MKTRQIPTAHDAEKYGEICEARLSVLNPVAATITAIFQPCRFETMDLEARSQTTAAFPFCPKIL